MRNIAVVGLVLLAGVFVPGVAAGSSLDAAMECNRSADGSWEVLSVTVQNTIANGRTTLDVLTYMKLDGMSTLTVLAGGVAVGSTQVPMDTGSLYPDYDVEGTWVSVGGLPASGDLTLVVTLAPASSIWGPCPTISIPIKRTAGVVLLGRWGLPFGGMSESNYVEKAWWGAESGNYKWIRGSCQNLAIAPISIKVESTGVAGSKTTKTVVKDQCDLVPPAKAKKKVPLLAGTIIIGSGSVIFKSTLRQAGTQRYKLTMTIGKVVRSFNRTARFETSYRIWQGTDAFWNTCISDGRDIQSSGGNLYCVVGARLDF